MKVINLFAGPGAGKSTTAAALYAELKYGNVNAELVQEAAKDAAWEGRGGKFFAAQQYILGEQSWRQWRLKGDVDVAVTDSPLPLGLVYMQPAFPAQSLRRAIMEDYASYDNFNVLITRNKVYNSKGRLQDEDEAKTLDGLIRDMLYEEGIKYVELPYSRNLPKDILWYMRHEGFFDIDKTKEKQNDETADIG